MTVTCNDGTNAPRWSVATKTIVAPEIVVGLVEMITRQDVRVSRERRRIHRTHGGRDRDDEFGGTGVIMRNRLSVSSGPFS
jgi:hypothetical protein